MLISRQIGRLTRLILCLFGLQATTLLTATTDNWWPLSSHLHNDPVDRPDTWNVLPPFGAVTDFGAYQTVSLRPFWTHFADHPVDTHDHWHVLYPLLNVYTREDRGHFTFARLVNGSWDTRRGAWGFEAWPFVFLNREPGTENNYAALWPLGGTLKDFIFRDRVDFALWPLYVRVQDEDEVRYSVPWPFIQILTGPQSRGWALWPLYGDFSRENDYHHTFALWPLHYHLRDGLDQEQPRVRLGFLPFYHRETAPGLKAESYLFPFFGYTKEFAPRPVYDETRYFWPLIVQGRGEERYVNRLLPFYAKETTPSTEKRWILWPLWQEKYRAETGLTTDETNVLFFLYRDKQQQGADFAARLNTTWPLYGYWNDEQGRKQFQLLDPLTAFFPGNKKVQANWSPLFALYRSDRRGEDIRRSLLWDAVTWRNAPDRSDISVAFLFERDRDDRAISWSLLKGFLTMDRAADGERHWSFLWRGRER